MAVCHFEVLLIPFVDAVAAFRGFDIYVSHACVLADDFPEDIALIVADVYSVDMSTRVLALHNRVLGVCRIAEEHEKE